MMDDESDPNIIIGRLQGLLERGDIDAFHAHLLASIPPTSDRGSAQIIAALETNLQNGQIFAQRGESPRFSLQQALNCYKALVGVE